VFLVTLQLILGALFEQKCIWYNGKSLYGLYRHKFALLLRKGTSVTTNEKQPSERAQCLAFGLTSAWE